MEVTVRDVPEMFSEVLARMKVSGVEEGSRNGPVLTIPEPMLVKVLQPWNRVLFDERRCANPFFHAMEVIWMMAGRRDLDWIQQFNSRFSEYADEDGTLHGAYGHRWRGHFSHDQILAVCQMLHEQPTTRRAVIGMWDPAVDCNTDYNDLPCNTHIYFRCVDGKLNMTVCNRSNDVVWGMTGANAVHMTCLHELIAHGAGLPMGSYNVMTNNAHLYTEVHAELLKFFHEPQRVMWQPDPLLEPQEHIADFLDDCQAFVEGDFAALKPTWMSMTPQPMYYTYLSNSCVHKIKCPQWRTACVQWLHWKRQ